MNGDEGNLPEKDNENIFFFIFENKMLWLIHRHT